MDMRSKVYLVRLEDGAGPECQALAVEKLFDYCKVGKIIGKNDFVAIKFHAGEKKNDTHVAPEIPAVLVRKVKENGGQPFLTETATLYRGERENAVRHILHAINQGFGIENVGAPFIPADGLTGNAEIDVEINCEINKTVKIAHEARMADCLLIISHPTGHIITGFAATIKNLGMGLTGRSGKLFQHSTMVPTINREKCILCGKCIKWCPRDAITEVEGKASIDEEKCVGCGQCLAVCKSDAVKFDKNWGGDGVSKIHNGESDKVKFDWKRIFRIRFLKIQKQFDVIEPTLRAESYSMQRNMAEHAYGVVKGKEDKCFFFNIAVNMTPDCDCVDLRQEKAIPDIGILASNDPVALDTATLMLTCQSDNENKDIVKKIYDHLDGQIQLKHAQKIGMGSMDYELVEVNPD